MIKSDWDKLEIYTRKEYIISYQTSRDKFSGKKDAIYIDIKIPKYSFKFLNWIEINERTKYHYRRIKEVKEI